MIDSIPALMVVLPLMAGVITVFTGKGDKPWAWATAITGIVFAMSIALLAEVTAHGPVTYNFGNWPSQYGIAYTIDAMNGFVLFVVSLIAAVTTYYSRLSVKDEIPNDRLHIFYALWLLTICGLLGITITGDTFNVYVLLEISSLTLYALIAMGYRRDRRALTASLRYVILGSVGASFLLLGIGYLMMITGTLNMVDMHDRLQVLIHNDEYSRTIMVAYAFLLVGLSLKLALFPLHMWLPNAYTYAPSAVTGLVAATATKVAVYMTIRFLFGIFGRDFSFGAVESSDVLLTCAGLGVLYTGIQAARQNNVKSVLAWSSLGQIGYIVIGFSLNNENGLTGSVVHILNHALIKGGMFLALGCVAYRLGGTRLTHLKGLGRKMPWTMAAFTAGGLGLIGFPLTGGFIGKWYIGLGALDAGNWLILVVIMLGSLLAVIYVFRVVYAIYFGEAEPDSVHATEAPASMVVCTWILIGMSLVCGLWSEWSVDLAANAAKAMLAGFGGAH